MSYQKEWLRLVDHFGGYYKCPTDLLTTLPTGRIVGYAGTYEDESGAEKAYVGFDYVNFAVIEEQPDILRQVAKEFVYDIRLSMSSEYRNKPFAICGMPMGGLALATVLSLEIGYSACRYIFTEKLVTQAKTSDSREKSELVWGRHKPAGGEVVFVVEDVGNNFSTTERAIAMIEKTGAVVGGILCFLNRSETVRETYVSKGTGREIPVIAIINEAMPQYRQDHPLVVQAVQEGRVSWKPKNDGYWDEMVAHMRRMGVAP